MTIQVGDRLPDVELLAPGPDRPVPVRTGELFAGCRAVLFAVPGAFTPTCSDEHLPGFLVRADELRAAGAERIVCTAVNDAFVLAAWQRAVEAQALTMLADGGGELARALGLEGDYARYGMGRRSRRYAMVLEDGVVRYLGVEPGPGVTVSGAAAVLAALAGRAPRQVETRDGRFVAHASPRFETKWRTD